MIGVLGEKPKKKVKKQLNTYIVDLTERHTAYIQVNAFSKADAKRRIQADLKAGILITTDEELSFDEHAVVGTDIELDIENVGEEEVKI